MTPSYVVELNRRKQAYVEVSKLFGFLWRLHDMDINAIAQRSGELVSRYYGDLAVLAYTLGNNEISLTEPAFSWSRNTTGLH